MLELLWIALASGGVAVTVTKSRVFYEPREAFALVVERAPYPLYKLATLVRCPYCASYWLVGLAWLLWTPRGLTHPVLMFFATTTVATAVAAVMKRGYEWSSP